MGRHFAANSNARNTEKKIPGKIMKQGVDVQSQKLTAKTSAQSSSASNIPGLVGLKDMKTSKLFQKFMQQQNPDEQQTSTSIPSMRPSTNLGNAGQAPPQKGSFMNYKSRTKNTSSGSGNIKADKVSALDKSKASMGGHQAQIMSESMQY